MANKMLKCLFCGDRLESQNIDRELGLYVGWCEKHNWIEAEYAVTKDNEFVLDELREYTDDHWNYDGGSTDVEEQVEELFCPLCGEAVSLMRAVSLDSIDKWDAYTFECPSHGVFKMKVECYSVWCGDQADEVKPIYSF